MKGVSTSKCTPLVNEHLKSDPRSGPEAPCVADLKPTLLSFPLRSDPFSAPTAPSLSFSGKKQMCSPPSGCRAGKAVPPAPNPPPPPSHPCPRPPLGTRIEAWSGSSLGTLPRVGWGGEDGGAAQTRLSWREGRRKTEGLLHKYILGVSAGGANFGGAGRGIQTSFRVGTS